MSLMATAADPHPRWVGKGHARVDSTAGSPVGRQPHGHRGWRPADALQPSQAGRKRRRSGRDAMLHRRRGWIIPHAWRGRFPSRQDDRPRRYAPFGIKPGGRPHAGRGELESCWSIWATRGPSPSPMSRLRSSIRRHWHGRYAARDDGREFSELDRCLARLAGEAWRVSRFCASPRIILAAFILRGHDRCRNVAGRALSLLQPPVFYKMKDAFAGDTHRWPLPRFRPRSTAWSKPKPSRNGPAQTMRF